MYSFRNDPGADGAGVACCDAVAPDGGRLDLTLGVRRRLACRAVGPRRGRPRHPGGERLPGARHAGAHRRRRHRPAPVAAEKADALVTTDRRLAVAVRVADCVPVLFADPDAGVVAAAHAGRVGLGAGVLPATVARMAELGAARITAWIGPHICGDCYEVPADLQADLRPGAPGRGRDHQLGHAEPRPRRGGRRAAGCARLHRGAGRPVHAHDPDAALLPPRRRRLRAPGCARVAALSGSSGPVDACRPWPPPTGDGLKLKSVPTDEQRDERHG